MSEGADVTASIKLLVDSGGLGKVKDDAAQATAELQKMEAAAKGAASAMGGSEASSGLDKASSSASTLKDRLRESAGGAQQLGAALSESQKGATGLRGVLDSLGERLKAIDAESLGAKIGEGLRNGIVAATQAVAGFVAASVTLAFAIDQIIKRVANYQDLAEASNSDPAGLASLAPVAAAAGTSIDGLNQGIANMQRALNTTRGAERVKDMLGAINIDIKEFRALRGDQQWALLATQLDKYADSSEKLAIVQRLTGDSTGAQVRAMEEYVARGGAVNTLTNEQIALADRYADAQGRATAEVTLFVQQLAINATPTFLALQTTLFDTIKGIVGVKDEASALGRDNALQTFAENAGLTLASVTDQVMGFASSIKTFALETKKEVTNLAFLNDVATQVGSVLLNPLNLPQALSSVSASLRARNDLIAEYNAGLEREAKRTGRETQDAYLKNLAAAKAPFMGPPEPPKPNINLGGTNPNGTKGTPASAIRASLQDESKMIQREVAAIKGELALLLAEYEAEETILSARRSAGLVSENEYLEAKREMITRTTNARQQALRDENKQLEDNASYMDFLARSTKGKAEEIANAQRRADQNRADATARIAENNRQITVIGVQGAAQLTAASVQGEAATTKLAEAYERAKVEVAEYVRQAQEAARIELLMLSMGPRAAGIERERLAIQEKTRQRVAQIEEERRKIEFARGAAGLSPDEKKYFEQRIALAQWAGEQERAIFEGKNAQEAVWRAEGINGAKKAWKSYVETVEDVAGRSEKAWAASIQAFEDALVTSLMNGKLSFSDFANFALAQLARFSLQSALGGLMGLLNFGSGAAGGGSLADPNLYTIPTLPGMASGGRVSRDKAYTVGERGREVFVPDQNGQIIPNHALGSSGSVVFSPTIYANEGVTEARMSRVLSRSFVEFQRNMVLARRNARGVEA